MCTFRKQIIFPFLFLIQIYTEKMEFILRGDLLINFHSTDFCLYFHPFRYISLCFSLDFLKLPIKNAWYLLSNSLSCVALKHTRLKRI